MSIVSAIRKTGIYKAYRKRSTKIRKYKYIKKLLPAVYNEEAKNPVEEKIVFMELRVDSLSESFKYIHDRLKNEYDMDIKIHYLRSGYTYQKQYLKNAEEFIRDMATAKLVFINDSNNLMSGFDVRPETKVFQLWHGCGAFKKFGWSTAELLFGVDEETFYKYPTNRNLFCVTVSSPEVSWAYEEAMGIKSEEGIVRPTGVSRTDVFFDEDYKKASCQKLQNLIPAVKDKKVILYAPTYRGHLADCTSPDKLDFEALKNAFGDEYVLLVKHHFLVKETPDIPDTSEGSFAFDVTNMGMDMNELLCAGDICITDYSSLIFEYSLLLRPMIFFAYDIEDYHDWRGFYYDYDQLTPGPVCRTNEEIIDHILNIDERFNKQEVIDFRYRFMRSCDGHATDRILELAFGQSREG